MLKFHADTCTLSLLLTLRPLLGGLEADVRESRSLFRWEPIFKQAATEEQFVHSQTMIDFLVELRCVFPITCNLRQVINRLFVCFTIGSQESQRIIRNHV